MQGRPRVFEADFGVDVLFVGVGQGQRHSFDVVPTREENVSAKEVSHKKILNLLANGLDEVSVNVGQILGSGHDEFLPLVLGHDKALLITLRRLSRRLPDAPHIGLPDRVGREVAQRRHRRQMTRRPFVQVERAHSRDVRAELAVDARALDAHEDAEVDARPVGVGRVAVDAPVVAVSDRFDDLKIELVPAAGARLSAGLADLVALERAEDLLFDGLDPLFALLGRAGLEMPLFVVQTHDMEFEQFSF